MARQLTVEERRTAADLHGKIRRYRDRNMLRRRYHDGEDVLHKMAFSVPRQFDGYAVPVGWPKKAVDVISSRCVTDGYSVTTDTTLVEDLNAVRADSNTGEHERQAIHAGVRYGIGFLFSLLGDPSRGEPAVVQFVRSPLLASATVDPRSGATVAALEVVDRGAVLYLPGRILTLSGTVGAWVVVDEQPSTRRVTVTPFINCGTPDKPMGQSRITRTLMGLTDAGVRTLHRSEVSAEFYSAPREALISATEEMFTDSHGNRRTGWEMILGGTWGIPDYIDPETRERVTPELKHIPQMTMQPFLEQFRLIASAVSGETSIPMSYLGVLQDSNPSSAEAISASEVDLVRVAKETMASMSAARRSVVLDVLTVLYGDLPDAALRDLRGVTPRWTDPRIRSITEQSQFVQLQVAAGNLQPGVESTLRLLPMSEDEVAASVLDNQRAAGSSVLDRLLASSPQGEATVAATGE